MLKPLLNNKRIMGIYILWFTLHFVMLVSSWYTTNSYEEKRFKKEFWPFTDHGFYSTYNLPEFLVYVISPALIVVAISLLKQHKDEA